MTEKNFAGKMLVMTGAYRAGKSASLGMADEEKSVRLEVNGSSGGFSWTAMIMLGFVGLELYSREDIPTLDLAIEKGIEAVEIMLESDHVKELVNRTQALAEEVVSEIRQELQELIERDRTFMPGGFSAN